MYFSSIGNTEIRQSIFGCINKTQKVLKWSEFIHLQEFDTVNIGQKIFGITKTNKKEELKFKIIFFKCRLLKVFSPGLS